MVHTTMTKRQRSEWYPTHWGAGQYLLCASLVGHAGADLGMQCLICMTKIFHSQPKPPSVSQNNHQNETDGPQLGTRNG
jgi:hypothetical protein